MPAEKVTVEFVGGEVTAVEYALKRQIHAFQRDGKADMARVYWYALDKLERAEREDLA